MTCGAPAIAGAAGVPVAGVPVAGLPVAGFPVAGVCADGVGTPGFEDSTPGGSFCVTTGPDGGVGVIGGMTGSLAPGDGAGVWTAPGVVPGGRTWVTAGGVVPGPVSPGAIVVAGGPVTPG